MATGRKMAAITKRKKWMAIVFVTIVIFYRHWKNSPGEQRESLSSCSEDILDGSQYTNQQTDGDFLSVSQRRPCQLRQYTVEETVTCLDRLSSIENDPSAVAMARIKFHIAFVGDSRIRIQYLSFLKVCNDLKPEVKTR